MSDQMSDVTNDDRDDREYCDDELVEFDVPTEFGPLPPPMTAETSTSDLAGDDEVNNAGMTCGCLRLLLPADILRELMVELRSFLN